MIPITSKLSDKVMRTKSVISRRGIVLVAVVVVFAISLMLFGLWARTAVQQQQQMRSQQYRAQALRLAEAGMRRAVARRAADSQYVEEVWQIPAQLLDQINSAQVRIRVTNEDGADKISYEATSEFPAGAVRRAQVSRRIEISRPVPEGES
jgi:type II secretory pathway component PulK